MKESRFIELLNLYVDHQISPAEAAELQDEVNGNPARRRLFRQYCQMQKACAILGERSRAEAPGSFAVEATVMARGERSGDVVEFPASRSRRRWLPVAALGAMAACVALVVVRNQPQPANTAASSVAVGQAGPSPALVVAATPSEPVSAAALQVEPKRFGSGAFISRTFAVASQPIESEALAVATPEAPALDWIAAVTLAPVRSTLSEDLEFESKPALRPDVRAFQSSRQMAPLTSDSTEFVAFKIQR